MKHVEHFEATTRGEGGFGSQEKINQIDPAIFRAYDIRGIVGQSLTEESLYLLGRAIGSLALEARRKIQLLSLAMAVYQDLFC